MNEASTSILKKRSKKLLVLGVMGVTRASPMTKSHKSLFASFSSEKEVLALLQPKPVARSDTRRNRNGTPDYQFARDAAMLELIITNTKMLVDPQFTIDGGGY